jgi:thiosulfate/3-mercaptopyruvate sulfurtransferase
MPRPYGTLISVDELHPHLGEEDWVVLDCRFDLAAPDLVEERLYPGGHIPGAIYAHLERDLSGQPTGANGRHPLPEPAQLVSRFSSWGIDAKCQVVAYDDGSGFAARAWWSLRYMGHLAAAVLDGGLDSWVARGHLLHQGVERRAHREFRGKPHPEMIVPLEDVLSLPRLLDARAPERFRGDLEPIDPVPGHIPGARSFPWARSLAPDGLVLPTAQVRSLLLEALDGAPPERAAAYCGSGVTACNIVLATEHAGLRGVRLYPGSWSEWCSDPQRGVEVGDPHATHVA